MTGRFIVFEGPDATGTSTQAALLAGRLTQEGRSVLLTAEPSSGPIGRSLRGYLQDGSVQGLPLQVLFSADRAWHIEYEVLPALKNGVVVVSDRYALSTLVYSAAQGLDVSALRTLNQSFMTPHCTIITLPPVEVALARLAKRASVEQFEHAEFQRTLHRHYRDESLWSGPTFAVDTSGAKDETAERIYATVKPYL